MTLDDDLRGDGEPEKEFHAGVARRMPRKRVAGGALFRNSLGEILYLDSGRTPEERVAGT